MRIETLTQAYGLCKFASGELIIFHASPRFSVIIRKHRNPKLVNDNGRWFIFGDRSESDFSSAADSNIGNNGGYNDWQAFTTHDEATAYVRLGE